MNKKFVFLLIVGALVFHCLGAGETAILVKNKENKSLLQSFKSTLPGAAACGVGHLVWQLAKSGILQSAVYGYGYFYKGSFLGGSMLRGTYVTNTVI